MKYWNLIFFPANLRFTPKNSPCADSPKTTPQNRHLPRFLSPNTTIYPEKTPYERKKGEKTKEFSEKALKNNSQTEKVVEKVIKD